MVSHNEICRPVYDVCTIDCPMVPLSPLQSPVESITCDISLRYTARLDMAGISCYCPITPLFAQSYQRCVDAVYDWCTIVYMSMTDAEATAYGRRAGLALNLDNKHEYKRQRDEFDAKLRGLPSTDQQSRARLQELRNAGYRSAREETRVTQ